jgi:hypothetical protein
MTAARIMPAIPGIRLPLSHLETEELMELLLVTEHSRAEMLTKRMVQASKNPALYARTLERVRSRVTLNKK